MQRRDAVHESETLHRLNHLQAAPGAGSATRSPGLKSHATRLSRILWEIATDATAQLSVGNRAISFLWRSCPHLLYNENPNDHGVSVSSYVAPIVQNSTEGLTIRKMPTPKFTGSPSIQKVGTSGNVQNTNRRKRMQVTLSIPKFFFRIFRM